MDTARQFLVCRPRLQSVPARYQVASRSGRWCRLLGPNASYLSCPEGGRHCRRSQSGHC
jgi:hypothetical protein